MTIYICIYGDSIQRVNLSYIDTSTVTEKASPLMGYSKFVIAKICSIRVSALCICIV